MAASDKPFLMDRFNKTFSSKDKFNKFRNRLCRIIVSHDFNVSEDNKISKEYNFIAYSKESKETESAVLYKNPALKGLSLILIEGFTEDNFYRANLCVVIRTPNKEEPVYVSLHKEIDDLFYKI